MVKAAASGITLNFRDTRTVKGMLGRGDRQHDIASYFGVNPARISEVANGTNNYPNAEPLPEADLPPPGPYLFKYALQSIIDTLSEAIEVLDLAEAENEIADGKAALVFAKETIQKKLIYFRKCRHRWPCEATAHGVDPTSRRPRAYRLGAAMGHSRRFANA
jgi:hypothetical protein